MKKIRVSTLLEPETLDKVSSESKEKSISVAAVIRQKIKASYEKGKLQ